MEKDYYWPRLVRATKSFFEDRFNLQEDKANELETIAEIEKGVVFKGTNLWILIFAIFVASVGLNVNSAAVIIGAMLISPLMGPIMGIGLGMGIYDFDLIIKGLRNLGIAVLISVLTSALYFAITPLGEAQSELLNRTQPTAFDVLIAFFGGLAGIIAGSRREKSNAIPGVAIATALMPPLCTAGYGLATAQWSYFFGAFYLFFINGVFISLATFIIVRFLRFHPKEFLDQATETRVKRLVFAIAVVTIVPSIFTGFYVVQKSLFETHVQQYINKVFNTNECQVINLTTSFSRHEKEVRITLYGSYVDSIDLQKRIAEKEKFNLHDAKIIIRQGFQQEATSLSNLGENLTNNQQRMQELYNNSQISLQRQSHKIDSLEQLISEKALSINMQIQILKKAKALGYPIEKLTIQSSILSNMVKDSIFQDTTFLANIKFAKAPKKAEIFKLQQWLELEVEQPVTIVPF